MLVILSFTGVLAETSLEVISTRNFGEHIFETGNKYPNISGFRGGSRITYNRDFYKGGFGVHQKKSNFIFSFSFLTTGWNVHTQKKSRDEDFAMGQVTVERGRKFSLVPAFLYDTAHTFSGTLNFADGIAKSTVFEYSLSLGIKYYFSRNSGEAYSGFFIISEPSHSYFKYLLYDVMQFVNRPLFYGPIGIGLSYTHSFVEIPLGLGYVSRTKYFQLESSLQLLVNYFRYRDFHYQRNLNFLGNGAGSGFIYQFIFQIPLPFESFLKFNYRGHRMFGMSHFYTKGGIVESDLLSNFYGNFQSYITTKEASIIISIEKTF